MWSFCISFLQCLSVRCGPFFMLFCVSLQSCSFCLILVFMSPLSRFWNSLQLSWIILSSLCNCFTSLCRHLFYFPTRIVKIQQISLWQQCCITCQKCYPFKGCNVLMRQMTWEDIVVMSNSDPASPSCFNFIHIFTWNHVNVSLCVGWLTYVYRPLD